ncbi:MAG: hypothetical protein ACTHQ3_20325 [Motilibacteraceae bacterium]
MSTPERVALPVAGRPSASARHLRPVRTGEEPSAGSRVVVAAHEPDYVSCRNLLPLRQRSHRRFSPLCFGLIPVGPEGMPATCPVCGGPALP